MTQAKPTGWVFIYIILGIIWGSSFLFTHVALEMLPPVGVVFWRLLLGALALGAVIAIRRVEITRNWRHWLLMAGGGAFMNALPFTLFAYAQQHVTSILASIINGATPIMTLLALLTVFRGEKLKLNVILGLLIGMGGVMIVLAVWQGFGENDPTAVLAMIAAVSCYGLGGPFIVRFVTPLKMPNEIMSIGQVGSASWPGADRRSNSAGGCIGDYPRCGWLGRCLHLVLPNHQAGWLGHRQLGYLHVTAGCHRAWHASARRRTALV